MKLGSCNTILQGDIRQIARTLQAQSVHCIVTSPPYYGLRDYGTAEWQGGKADCDHSYQIKSPLNEGFNERWGNAPGDKKQESWRHERQYQKTCPKCGAIRKDAQIGLEASPQEYVETLVGIFRELRRVLRDDGSLWLNLGDSYNSNASNQNGTHGEFDRPSRNGAFLSQGRRNKQTDADGLKPKDLIGIPWRVALALQADGWYLRSDIIWSKPNPMPESVTDRPTKAHEYIFLLSKSPRYFYDQEAVREDASNDSGYAKQRANGTPQIHNKPAGIILGRKTDPHGGLNVAGNTPTRNRRTVWVCASKPFSGAHFATFPPDLIRPAILAGCPERVCVECGAPWVRVVEKEASNWALRKQNGASRDDLVIGSNANHGKGVTHDLGGRKILAESFRPTCTCNAPTAPGVVFDPFMGSGTVAQVAIEEDRNWLGCELNQDYIDLAWQRINAAKRAKLAGKNYAKTMAVENGHRQLSLIGGDDDQLG